MSVIGSIAVNVVMKTGQLVKDVKKGRKELQAFQKTAKNVRKAMLGMGAVAGGSFVAAMVKASRSIDETAKAARRLGTTVEALQGLQHAADQTAGSSDGLVMSLQRIARRTAEAAQGSGEAVKALKELGLDAERISKLTVDKQFMAIADAMERVTEHGDKMRLAMKLGDSEFVKFLPTLNAGTDALAKYNAEAAKFGFTDAQAKSVEKMNDEIDLLVKSMNKIPTQAVSTVAGGPRGISGITSYVQGVSDYLGIIGEFQSGTLRNRVGRVRGGVDVSKETAERNRLYSKAERDRSESEKRAIRNYEKAEKNRLEQQAAMQKRARGVAGNAMISGAQGFLGRMPGAFGRIGSGIFEQFAQPVRQRVGRFRRETDLFRSERRRRRLEEEQRREGPRRIGPTQTGAIEANTAAGFRALREARTQDIPKKQLREQKQTNNLLQRQNLILDRLQIETV